MFIVNGQEVNVEHFPDGTQHLNVFVRTKSSGNHIIWKYESEEEYMTLWFIVNHMRAKCPHGFIYLTLPYVPNARYDRIKESAEVFTLKYFAKFINSLEFDEVSLFDPHSDVSVALFNNCSVISPKSYITKAINSIPGDDKEIILYYPDAGCVKRLKDMFPGLYLYGEKNRDWKTGEILGLELKGPVDEVWSIENKAILMVDDICSYGGTFYYSAKELKRAFPDTKIYSYASHTENKFSTLQKAFDEKLIEMHFTTDSIYRRTNDKIQVIKC